MIALAVAMIGLGIALGAVPGAPRLGLSLPGLAILATRVRAIARLLDCIERARHRA